MQIRQRKLNTRTNLNIIREEDLEAIDHEFQGNLPTLDNGVEKGEASQFPISSGCIVFLCVIYMSCSILEFFACCSAITSPTLDLD